MSVDVRCLWIIAVSILPIFSPAQEWVARYNGPGNDDDESYAIALDSSGYIYVTGESYSFSTGESYATVKYDSSGLRWELCCIDKEM